MTAPSPLTSRSALLCIPVYEAGVNDKDIQLVLRHADVETTRESYVQPNTERTEAGTRKFAAVLKKQYGIKRKGL